jgi:hypothetical protein
MRMGDWEMRYALRVVCCVKAIDVFMFVARVCRKIGVGDPEGRGKSKIPNLQCLLKTLRHNFPDLKIAIASHSPSTPAMR